MNKSYRSIFNEETQTWVAVSEHTSAQGKKSSGSSTLMMMTGVTSGIGLSIASANAQVLTPSVGAVASATVTNGNGAVIPAWYQNWNGTLIRTSAQDNTGYLGIAAGSNAHADGRAGSIAIGDSAFTDDTAFIRGDGFVSPVAFGGGNIALGAGATAHGYASMALGAGSTTAGTATIALGQTAWADGRGAIAAGTGSLAFGDGSAAYGYASFAQGKHSISMGYLAGFGVTTKNLAGTAGSVGDIAIGALSGSKMLGNRNIALGYQAGSVVDTTTDDNVMIGTRTMQTGGFGVAIGYSATGSGLDSIVIGLTATGGGADSISIGTGSNVSGVQL